MVSQSTMFSHEFEELASYLAGKYPELIVFDTVCGATKERQADLQLLVDEGAEAVVVIGGRHSANTKKLAKLAAMKERPTFHVETAEELEELGVAVLVSKPWDDSELKQAIRKLLA